MTGSNTNKRTINFTDDDKKVLMKNEIIKWWLNKYHKKTLKQIDKLVEKHMKEVANQPKS